MRAERCRIGAAGGGLAVAAANRSRAAPLSAVWCLGYFIFVVLHTRKSGEVVKAPHAKEVGKRMLQALILLCLALGFPGPLHKT